ncbi:MAG: T9SS type A sorting domain-containing protein, partial [Candidatus Cloacimonetes bacterium]|nr:T9SS type A sorting domain-containing protein [Candidatus Cloacimonadota bacterium]
LNITLENCNMQVNNTIVSGNSPYEVAMFAFNESTYADVSFNNCLVTGGSDSFFLLAGDISHTWLDGNLFGLPSFRGGDANNPLFYSPASNSACIDNGTPDISGLSLLPYDLAGNNRIWNGRIDMGCYEYGSEPWVANDDPYTPVITDNIMAINYPNPFNPETTISFFLPQAGETELSIYNLKGQKVRSLLSAPLPTGTHRATWNGMDDHNKPVSSGIYFYRINANQHSYTGKMILAK